MCRLRDTVAVPLDRKAGAQLPVLFRLGKLLATRNPDVVAIPGVVASGSDGVICDCKVNPDDEQDHDEVQRAASLRHAFRWPGFESLCHGVLTLERQGRAVGSPSTDVAKMATPSAEDILVKQR